MDLYLCTTLLHVRISQTLIKRSENKSRIVYIMDEATYNQMDKNSKEKQRAYIEECDEFLQYNEKNYIDKINELVGEYNQIAFASYDNKIIEKIVHESNVQHIIGFDDGYASIYAKGMYTMPAANYLKSKVEKHYTIYQSEFHVIPKEKLVYLPIKEIFDIPSERIKNNKKLTVFLGEEILANPELGLKFNQIYVDEIKPDIYVPHPRARFMINYDKISEVSTLFEEQVAKWLLDYEELEVYHFSSSAAIHLGRLEGVIFRGIAIKPLEKRQKEMEKEGVKFEHVELHNWF